MLALGLWLVGCSGSEEKKAAGPVVSVFQNDAGTGRQASPGTPRRPGQDPIVEGVVFEPPAPESLLRIRAIPRVSGEWTSLIYEWSVNGESFGENAARVPLPELSRGDKVGLRITPFRDDREGRSFETSLTVANQKPRIRGVTIDRVEDEERAASAGEQWKAVVDAEDPDGDRVEIEYRWFVNGNPVENEEATFAAGDLHPGDHLGVHARAYDGRVWSDDFNSGEIEVGNVPPSIVSIPPRPDATGYFRYVVKVADAKDPSTLHFELRKAPPGMKIDERSGVVTWDPDTDQAGRHEVEIVVRDEQGSEATQDFSLALVTVTDPAPGPAAAP